MAEYRADVVIVGAGVAGLLAAWKLVRAGADVLLLDSGPRVNRAEALGIYRSAVAKTPESPYPDTPYAPQPSVLDPNKYYVQVGPEMFKSTYTRRVGGSTWHWLGTSLRHMPNDFRAATRYGFGSDWPISYEQLEPWYGEAERELGVSGDSQDDLGSPRSTGFPQRALAPTYLDTRIGVALAPLGIPVKVTPQARNSEVYQGRPPCCGNATCVPICPVAAKYDAATVHGRLVEEYGGQIMEASVAHFVEVGPEGRVTAVRFKRPDGSEHRAVGCMFVIAAHAIETPKLLLMSRTGALPNGVANRSDALGRYLMDHPIKLSWALAKEPLYPYRSPLENAGIEIYRDGDHRREHAAFRSAVGEDGWSFPGTPPVALVGALIKEGFRGRALAEELDRRAARQFRFAGLVEQEPVAESRVTPAWEQLDAIGIPRPQLDYRLSEYTRRGLAAAEAFHDRVFDAVGVSERQHSESFFGAGHVMGTYRMGDDPTTSVVNAEQRSHDHPNLFLLGSGVFPTVGTANPTLTIAALALWAGDTITRELGYVSVPVQEGV